LFPKFRQLGPDPEQSLLLKSERWPIRRIAHLAFKQVGGIEATEATQELYQLLDTRSPATAGQVVKVCLDFGMR
jgi:hypothetical protein